MRFLLVSIQWPASCVIVFCFQVGKSTFLLQLIENFHRCFERDIKSIVYCAPCLHAAKDSAYVAEMHRVCDAAGKSLSVFDRPPTLQEIKEQCADEEVFLILDDLTSYPKKQFSLDLAKLASSGTSHFNINSCLILQNPYQDSGNKKIDLVTVAR